MSETAVPYNTTNLELYRKHPELVEEIKQDLSNCFVPLIGVLKTKDILEDGLAGSGTLVNIEGTKGILTAKHVIEQKLKRYNLLALSLSEKGYSSVIFFKYLEIIGAKNNVDLAFIIIPELKVKDIEAIGKSFYNLKKRMSEVLAFSDKLKANIINAHNYLWLTCGVPDVRTKIKFRTQKPIKVTEFTADCGLGDIELLTQSNDSDTYQTNVDYTRATNAPSSFGGVSGGGLWRVKVIPDQSMTGYRFVESVLWGVPFSQTALVDNKRSLKCHGPISIYKNLYQAVLDRKEITN